MKTPSNKHCLLIRLTRVLVLFICFSSVALADVPEVYGVYEENLTYGLPNKIVFTNATISGYVGTKTHAVKFSGRITPTTVSSTVYAGELKGRYSPEGTEFVHESVGSYFVVWSHETDKWQMNLNIGDVAVRLYKGGGGANSAISNPQSFLDYSTGSNSTSSYSAQAVLDSATKTAFEYIKTGEKPPCTTYVIKTLSTLGVRLTRSEITAMQISEFSPTPLGYRVIARDPTLRGSAGVLIDKGIANQVSVADLRSGDIIQYWYQFRSGVYGGHTAIVYENLGGGNIRLIDSNISDGINTTRINVININEKMYPTAARLR